jgi:hypothetical protein
MVYPPGLKIITGDGRNIAKVPVNPAAAKHSPEATTEQQPKAQNRSL